MRKIEIINFVFKTIPYFILLLLLSCSNSVNSKQSEAIRSEISSMFQAKEVIVERGSAIGSGGSHGYLEVNVSKSAILEKDTSIDPSDAASTIAFFIYHIIKDNPDEKGSSINVGLNCNNKNYKYEFPYALIAKSYENTILADSFFQCMIKGEYENAYTFFSNEFKISMSEEKFKEIFNSADSAIGRVTSYKLNGIKMNDLNMNENVIKTMRIEFYAIRNRYTKIQLFFDVKNAENKIRWINM